MSSRSPSSLLRAALLRAETVAALAAAKAIVRLLPFRIWARWVNGDERALPDATALDRSRGIGRTVERIGRRVPWSSRCLDQALAVRLMLRRRGIASVLQIGVRKDNLGAIEAHAWLLVGGRIVVGGAEAGGFQPIFGRIPDDSPALRHMT